MEISRFTPATNVYAAQNSPSARKYQTNQTESTQQNTNMKTVVISDAGKNAEAKFNEIAEKYDMTNISANEIMTMSKELYDNKLISSTQMLDMYTLPGIDFDLNEKVNYIDHVTKEINGLKLTNDGSDKIANVIKSKEWTLNLIKEIG